MPISCHFRDCKALLVTSLTRVSGAIASVQTFYLYVVEGARASIKYDKSGIQSQKLGGVASVWKWVPGTAPPPEHDNIPCVPRLRRFCRRFHKYMTATAPAMMSTSPATIAGMMYISGL